MRRLLGVVLALLLLAMPAQAQTYDFLDENIADRLVKHGENFDPIHKFGTNPDIDTGSDPEDIWAAGGLYVFPSAADTTTIVSDSADDDGDPVGTGARTVLIQGLDSSWNRQSETVTLNGTSAVTLANEYLRVNGVIVASAGSGETNAGELIIAVDGTTVAVVVAGFSQTRQAVYSVPNDYTEAHMIDLCASLEQAITARTAVMLLRVRLNDGVWVNKHQWELSATGTSVPCVRFPYWIRYPPKTDIVIRCQSVSSNDTGISAWFNLVQRF